MNGASLSVGLEDFPQAMGFLMDLQRRAEDTTPLMEEIGFYGEQSTKERFYTETSPDGVPWLPSLRVKLQGGKTLNLSGQLRDSMTSDATRTTASWGTNKIYAGVHQFGATIRPKSAGALAFTLPGLGLMLVQQVTIPARPYLGVNDQDKREIGNLVEDYYFGGLAGLA